MNQAGQNSEFLGVTQPISVVIPTYNRKSQVLSAINSALLQSTPAFEIVIVDDGSKDQTLREIYKWLARKSFTSASIEYYIEKEKKSQSPTKTPSFSSGPTIIEEKFFLGVEKSSTKRIRIIRQRNRGVSAARNLGISLARKPWIAFLDSDDEWLPKKIEMQFKLLEKTPELKVIHGEEIWIRNGRRVNQMKKHQKSGGRIFSKCVPLCAMSPSTILIHRDVFDKVGFFNESYPACEDYDLWLKITSNFEVGFVSEPTIKKFGGHEDQLSRRYKGMDFWRVLSLHEILSNSDYSIKLRSNERELALETLKKKCEILLNGYKKHENFKNYDKVEKILSAHS